MIKFEKIPYDIWRAEWLKANEMDDVLIKDKFESYIKELYKDIKFPLQINSEHAYKLFAPYPIELIKKIPEVIPLGIKCITDESIKIMADDSYNIEQLNSQDQIILKLCSKEKNIKINQFSFMAVLQY